MNNIFSERHKKLLDECIEKNRSQHDEESYLKKKDFKDYYKDFFNFEIYDIFFKDNIARIILEFNEPKEIYIGRYEEEKEVVYVLEIVFKKLTENNRFFYNNYSYSCRDYHNCHIPDLKNLPWEHLFDIIEVQYHFLSNEEKEDFLKTINIFFKKNRIPWFLEKGEIKKNKKKSMIINRTCFNKLIDFENVLVPDIKIITGIRRSGKTTLLENFCDFLTFQTMNENNVIFISLESKEYEKLLEPNKLYNYIEKKYVDGVKNYLIIDEIQKCKDFEKTIIYLHKEDKFDIYLSGSNAFILSSDLATLFGGRCFDLKIYPFSFKEFNTYFNYSNPIDSFDKYLKKGGMPGSYFYKKDEDVSKYINGIYKKTILKDIVERFKIKNEQLLISIADYLMDNIGQKTSIKNIANYLKKDDKIVSSYVDYLCKSFLFYPFKGYDIKGKKIISDFNKKYYLADISFKFANLGTKDMNYGRIYENIVAIELLRRDYEVYIGILKEKEIDFVAEKNGNKNYIQVSYDISNDETFKREISPLLSIKDGYSKLLIARTKQPEYQHEGIEIIDIGEWLNNNEK